MYLKKIKLSGFKSFVDPTTIPINTNRTGVVGPNGCGKSNIIDAIRWVMGESSAKHLRGDSMADVIFSGSNQRKPVGKASVELIFDNTDGKAPGQYASYAEISIRREASRDGQSNYYLNRTRCRRKDIQDIFLGTGLGPRTYSIIEQGMVTRIVESKPEELRGFLEEAAGISRYKERRRETENRIRHTRENLERVEDIRQELDKQLGRLKRQANAAERYKTLKTEERLTQAQLYALRWKSLDEKLKGYDSELLSKQTELEKLVADQREIEAKIESLRNTQTEENEKLNKVQEEFYGIGAEISNIEQAIQHTRESRAQQLREQEQVNRSWEEASQHLESDMEKMEQLNTQLEQSAPQFESQRQAEAEARQELEQAESAMQEWQADWQVFNEASAEPEKVREIQRDRIQRLEQHLQDLEERKKRLLTEQSELQAGGESGTGDVASKLQDAVARYQEAEASLERTENSITEKSETREQLKEKLEGLRGELQKIEARLASLQELQAAARGLDDSQLNEWLAQQGLSEAGRLSGRVQVESGWERAVERVLGNRLNAICVDDIDRYAGIESTLAKSRVDLIDTSAPETVTGGSHRNLGDVIQSEVPIGNLLNGVRIAESLDQALGMRNELGDHESIVTPSGAWVGRNWLSLSSEEGSEAGILKREQEINQLEREQQSLQQTQAGLDSELEALQNELQGLQQQKTMQRNEVAELNTHRGQLAEAQAAAEARSEQTRSRLQQVEVELGEIEQQNRNDSDALDHSRRLLAEAEGQSGEHGKRREELQRQRANLSEQLEQARIRADDVRQQLHDTEIERQRMQTAFESTEQSAMRLQGQLQHLESRRKELNELLSREDQPEQELKQKLEGFLQNRVSVETRLQDARNATQEVTNSLREQEQQRSTQERKVQEFRESMESARMARQELLVRKDTLVEKIDETGHKLDETMQSMPAEADESTWEQNLESIHNKINRLGPINLVAIEEYEEEAERKHYLDKQNEDLSKALATLEEAMHKIDKETRTRFRETYDRVNTGLQGYFPQLFGGGHAQLELTGDDLLSTGVTIMARPPGKRNSTIHLLSGGEKALTAVALIFAIFQLNPAPFCLLDEVDAPLDDANVERYSETIKEMSETTQLIFVTHNKITMESAEVLLGVTMSEPGVSRLVAVDVDEALEMVAQ
ncbi:MAG: chromosome segregation protein SMC [Acidiferrobacterales bacterium]